MIPKIKLTSTGILSSAVICVFMLLAGHATAAEVKALEPVTVQLKWKHQFQFAGYYMAIEKGYYADAGMDVRLIEAVVGKDPMSEVVEGRADFGVGTTDILLMRNEGKKVVVLANIFQHSPLAMMVLKTSGITNIHQLAREKLMMEPHSAELFAYFTREGVSLEKLQLVDHTFNVTSLLEGRVDAMSVYNTDESFLLYEAGIPYQLLRPIESGIDFYGDNLFTMENTISDHPERVAEFTKATKMGWQYALENIDETVDLIQQKYGGHKSRDHLVFEAEKTKSLILSDIVNVGYMNPHRWQRIADTYKELGMLPRGFSLDTMIYNPDKNLIPSWIWQVLVIGTIILLGTFIFATYVIRINRKLISSEAKLKYEADVKDKFFTIIAHDLKEPFNALLGMTELMSKMSGTDSRERMVEYSTDVNQAGKRFLNLLTNLLEWSKLQMTGSKPDPETIKLGMLVQDCIALLKPIAQKKKISLTNNIKTATAFADPNMLRSVINNLMNNALKFTPSGGKIEVSSHNTGSNVHVTVSDTGVGMTANQAEKIFSLDQKTSTLGTAGETGTGLGLPLCKDMLERNGRQIWVESIPGIGSQFHFTLPMTAE